MGWTARVAKWAINVKFSKNFLPQEKFQKMVSDFSMINGLFKIFMTGAGLYLT